MSYDRHTFERNYKYLMENMSGSWFSGIFSKGDEATMREALMEIAKTPEGRSVISQLPPNFKIDAKRHLDNNNIGFYDGETNSVQLLSKEGIKPQTLLHELKHAVQEKQGLSYATGLSKDQMMCTDKLSEAETISWERVLYATAKHKHGQKYADTHWKTDGAEASDDALYKSCLKRCNGNEEKAQKMMVGTLIPEYMKARIDAKTPKNISGWVEHYDSQALRNALGLARQGKLSKNGDSKKFNEILSHYCKKYGMSKKDIEKSVTKDFKERHYNGETGNPFYKDIDTEIAKNEQKSAALAQVKPPVLPKRYTNENNIRKDLSKSLGGLSNKEWQNLRKSLDANKDGKLDNDELKGFYQMLDQNEDGKITKADINEAGGRHEVMASIRLISQDNGRC